MFCLILDGDLISVVRRSRLAFYSSADRWTFLIDCLMISVF